MSFVEYNCQTSAKRMEFNKYNSTNVTLHNLMNHRESDLAMVPTINHCINTNEDYFYYQVSHSDNKINTPHHQVSSCYENYQYLFDYTHTFQEDQLKNTLYEQSGQKIENKTYEISQHSKRIKRSKQKRHRTVFTFEQLETLESYYKHKQYVTSRDRKYLQELLKIKDNTIKVWFQNRRLKDKREGRQNLQISTNEVPNEPVTSTTNQHFIDQIDITTEIDLLTEEMKQKKEKDELDDFLLNLIKPIHNDRNIYMELPVTATQKQNLFYEPISPPDSNEENEEIKSRIFEAKESLKTFLNFQDA